jgi:hypothetical protein
MMTAPPLFSVEPVLCVHALMHMHDQCRHGPARPGRTGSSVDQWQHGANSLYFCSAGSAAHCAAVQVGVWAGSTVKNQDQFSCEGYGRCIFSLHGNI